MATCLWPVPDDYEEIKNGAEIGRNHNRGHNYWGRIPFPYGSIHDAPATFRASHFSPYLMAKRIMAFRRCSWCEAVEATRYIPDVGDSSSADGLCSRYSPS